MRVLVTGVSRGIGGAICRKLVADARAAGKTVKIAASATGGHEDIHNIVRDLRGEGVEIEAFLGNLTELEAPGRIVREAISFLGGLDGLVANAGRAARGRLIDAKLADWDFCFNLNARSFWLMAQAAYPALKDSRGSIVSIGSLSGTAPVPELGPYSPSKAALAMVVRQLSIELAPDGIRVNGIQPGMIKTRVSEKLDASEIYTKWREFFVPMGRLGEAHEIAGVTTFLLGPDASYITGQNFVVDGGHAQTPLIAALSSPKKYRLS